MPLITIIKGIFFKRIEWGHMDLTMNPLIMSQML